MHNTANITAWFRDAATRHPDIRHDPASNKPRFFELEWDEMMQEGHRMVANTGWNLVLEDYREQFHDNNGGYISVRQTIAFMVVRHIERGKPALRLQTFQDARVIAKSIITKLLHDCGTMITTCAADVPEGVVPPRAVDLSTLVLEYVVPPVFDHAVGVRATIAFRTDHDETFDHSDTAWLPL